MYVRSMPSDRDLLISTLLDVGETTMAKLRERTGIGEDDIEDIVADEATFEVDAEGGVVKLTPNASLAERKRRAKAGGKR